MYLRAPSFVVHCSIVPSYRIHVHGLPVVGCKVAQHVRVQQCDSQCVRQFGSERVSRHVCVCVCVYVCMCVCVCVCVCVCE